MSPIVFLMIIFLQLLSFRLYKVYVITYYTLATVKNEQDIFFKNIKQQSVMSIIFLCHLFF